MIDWGWVIDNRAMIGDLLWQHARMVLLALLFGSLLTGGLLAITLRWPATAQPLITLCGVLFTIPSLALFILLLPFTGLSLTTSLIGLTLYSLLILLRNMLAGIEKLPQAALESARALFDLWIEAAEEAWAELAFTDEYRKAYGEMTNAMMRVRLGLQGEVERMSALLGMPGRTEVDALARKVAELERAQYQARRAASQAAAAGKATSAPATRKPVVAADAAAEARAAPAARAAAPARAATVAKPAKAAKVAKAGKRKVAGKPRKQPRPAEVRVRWMALDGSMQEEQFSGLWATCVQHEIDHLNGKLFIDFLGPLKRQMITRKMEKLKRERARQA